MRELFGLAFASANPVATLAVAITRQASTRLNISIRRNIRSCALSRRRLGYGAMFTRRGVCSINVDDQKTRVLDNIPGKMRLFSHDKKRIVLLIWNNRQSAK